MPYLSPDYTRRVTEQSDMVSTIKDFVELKQQGTQLVGLSPFVKESSPSFQVSDKKQIWKDFASGKGGNDAVSFLMANGMTYPDAIIYLGTKLGMAAEYEAMDEKAAKAYAEKQEEAVSLRSVLQATLVQYQKAFEALPDSHPAKKEIYGNRGYTPEQAAAYGIGYAPGNKFIYNLLVNAGRKTEGVTLAIINDKGNDRYWERVIYPIYTAKGELSGLAGRDLTGDKKAAKWINSSETPLYNKSRTWYGLATAKDAIRTAGCAYVTEGYNDVIGPHINGVLNTVAPCGTAITEEQVTILRRYCDVVRLTMDGDRAGKASAIKHISLFLERGFRVFVHFLPEGYDPDTLSRKQTFPYCNIATQKEAKDLITALDACEVDGFRVLMDETLTGDQVYNARKGHDLAKTISLIEDEAMRGIYAKWLAKEVGMTAAKVVKIVEGFRESALKEAERLAAEKEAAKNPVIDFQLPKGIDVTKEIVEQIKNYGLFFAKNQIWMKRGEAESPYFESVSNFEVHVIQHMSDEKYPKKLVRVKNVRQEERIFDVLSGVFAKMNMFDEEMSNNGNYLYKGTSRDFLALRAYLYDAMGVGEMVNELGWNNDGFWVWNNMVTLIGEPALEIDDNGIFQYKNTSYYVPSANHIYANNDNKYMPQKQLEYVDGGMNFAKYAGKFYQVHRELGAMALLFTLASMHRDVIIKSGIMMPLMFLYGPPGTGKDKLIEACQRFYGEPQTATALGSKISTAKSQIRKLAQFKNIIVQLSEYQPGDQRTNETIKGLWDNLGYSIGTLDSRYGTDSIPISASIFITGNAYIDDEAAITRVIPFEMLESEFNAEQRRWFNELEDMMRDGISHLTGELLQHRPHFVENFKETHRRVFKELKANVTFEVPQDRMLQNISVLLATYELLKDRVSIPFDFNTVRDILVAQLEKQCRRLKSASTLVKFWECFLACVNTQQEPLIHGREFEIKDDKLYFQLTHTYNKVSAKWWSQFNEMSPSKDKINEELKASEYYVTYKSSHRMEQSNSSVIVLDYSKLPVRSDLNSVMEWKSQIANPFPPAPPSNQMQIGQIGSDSEDATPI